jgi:hypothetical protein
MCVTYLWSTVLGKSGLCDFAVTSGLFAKFGLGWVQGWVLMFVDNSSLMRGLLYVLETLCLACIVLAFCTVGEYPKGTINISWQLKHLASNDTISSAKVSGRATLAWTDKHSLETMMGDFVYCLDWDVGAQIKHICKGVSGWVKQTAFASVGGHHPITEGLNRTRRQRKGEFALSAWLLELEYQSSVVD